jgi:ligand-binding SRPBCC domain-containing protein
MGYTFQTEQWLPYSRQEVFAFFADPSNLPSLIPAWQKARIESATIVPPPRRPGTTDAKAAGVGSRITLSFKPFRFSPLRVRWEAEITDFAWNSHFRDVQLRGPFAAWSHSHYLRSIDRAGVDITLIVDQIEYRLPFGPVGKLSRRWVEKQLRRAFEFRQEHLAEILANRCHAASPREAAPRAS